MDNRGGVLISVNIMKHLKFAEKLPPFIWLATRDLNSRSTGGRSKTFTPLLKHHPEEKNPSLITTASRERLQHICRMMISRTLVSREARNAVRQGVGRF